jgi:hypothetical protein
VIASLHYSRFITRRSNLLATLVIENPTCTVFYVHGRLAICHLLTPFLSVFEFWITFTLRNEVSIRLCVNYEANANGPAFRFWYER